MEVKSDVTLAEMGDFRWLTVGPPGQDDITIVLMAIPGEPVMDAATAEQVRELVGKGFAGAVFLTTDNCQAAVDELKSRGVVFSSEPTEMPYGIDSGFTDPSGNSETVECEVLARGLGDRDQDPIIDDVDNCPDDKNTD